MALDLPPVEDPVVALQLFSDSDQGTHCWQAPNRVKQLKYDSKTGCETWVTNGICFFLFFLIKVILLEAKKKHEKGKKNNVGFPVSLSCWGRF